MPLCEDDPPTLAARGRQDGGYPDAALALTGSPIIGFFMFIG